MLLIDSKYINLISARLRNFKRKKDTLYQCSCPICGDSEKDSTKARGYFFIYKNDFWYKCHNCGGINGKASPFSFFLKTFDPVMYNDYRFEKFGSKVKKEPEYQFDKPEFNTVTETENEEFFDELRCVADLDKSHPVYKYMERRKIPLEFWNDIYLADKFKRFTNRVKPDTFDNEDYDEPRLIIPFFDEDGKVFAYQGRSFNPKSVNKYITIKLDDDMPKIYGLDRIKKSKRALVLEGPINSMFLDNAIGCAGADLNNSIGLDNPVFVFDNDPRNKQIVKAIENSIKAGNKTIVWDNRIRDNEDINDLVLRGWSTKQINDYLDQRTFSGLRAKLEFDKWRKV